MRSRQLFRFLLAACVLVPAATAQIQVHFGMEAGVPLTDTLVSSSEHTIDLNGPAIGSTIFSLDRYNSETKRLLIGPSFRVEMQSGLGIEVDALYQRIDYDHATRSMLSGAVAASVQIFEQTTANRWQFPLLIQYSRTLARSSRRLFIEAGPSISRIAASRSKITTTTTSDSSTSLSELSVRGQGGTLAGIVAGGGVDFSLSRLRLRPEFRYHHWFSQNVFSSADIVGAAVVAGQGTFSTILTATPLFPSFRIQQNEASFLVGLTF